MQEIKLALFKPFDPYLGPTHTWISLLIHAFNQIA